MSIAEQPDEPKASALPPDEALRRARPLPRRAQLVIEDLPDDAWTAFQEALAET